MLKFSVVSSLRQATLSNVSVALYTIPVKTSVWVRTTPSTLLLMVPLSSLKVATVVVSLTSSLSLKPDQRLTTDKLTRKATQQFCCVAFPFFCTPWPVILLMHGFWQENRRNRRLHVFFLGQENRRDRRFYNFFGRQEHSRNRRVDVFFFWDRRTGETGDFLIFFWGQAQKKQEIWCV